jgi:hypothetical protein
MALKDYFLTDSNKSIMRLTFFMTICTGLLISIATSVFALIVALSGKTMDLSSIVTIVGLLVGGSFLGKAGQTFGEALEQNHKKL